MTLVSSHGGGKQDCSPFFLRFHEASHCLREEESSCLVDTGHFHKIFPSVVQKITKQCDAGIAYQLVDGAVIFNRKVKHLLDDLWVCGISGAADDRSFPQTGKLGYSLLGQAFFAVIQEDMGTLFQQLSGDSKSYPLSCSGDECYFGHVIFFGVAFRWPIRCVFKS